MERIRANVTVACAVVSLVGVLGSGWMAMQARTAQSSAEGIVKSLGLVHGGSVTKDGRIERSEGELFAPEVLTPTGSDGNPYTVYKVTFHKAFRQPPIVLVSGDTGEGAPVLNVIEVTHDYFIVAARTYQNAIVKSAFSFVVIASR